MLENKELIDIDNTGYGTIIIPKKRFMESNYTEEELKVLSEVTKEFDVYNCQQITEYSHKEDLWKNSTLKDEIKVEDSYKLRILN